MAIHTLILRTRIHWTLAFFTVPRDTISERLYKERLQLTRSVRHSASEGEGEGEDEDEDEDEDENEESSFDRHVLLYPPGRSYFKWHRWRTRR